jgi:hypothetical protein
LSCATTAVRIGRCSTLPSSNRKAATMCFFSTGDMLFQNSVAWL